MRILLDSCALGRQWNNLRKINKNITLLKPSVQYRHLPDKEIIKFARENNYTILSYDEDMYNLWLIEKNFNLIYVRNIFLTQSPNSKLINGVSNCTKMTNEEKEYRQKIIETYITYIRNYVNSLNDNKNFVIRLGCFEHNKINCITELINHNRAKIQKISYLQSSIAFNDELNNNFILSYSDKNTNCKVSKEIEYYV
jgi:predicted nuclease of predicted toxin-antitoxin system